MIFLLGAPRSGTTWLAKIFDSHPDVLYRHEPDILLRSENLPYFCRAEDVERWLPDARAYIDSLVGVRGTKSAGTLPVFAKSYHSALQHRSRQFLVYLGRVREKLPPTLSSVFSDDIPDLVRIDRVPGLRIALKSVGSLGRARLFAQARPEARTVLIVRHPCGHVASFLRGRRLNKMPRTLVVGELVETEQAQRHGIDAARFEAMSPLEQLAWRWVISNEKAMQDLEGDERIQVIAYEDLCAEPQAVSRRLFDFTGLDWNPQTEAFLRVSTEGDDGGYFSIERDPKEAAARWRRELGDADVEAVLRIAAGSLPGRLFDDVAAA